jgi:hypothetical protein
MENVLFARQESRVEVSLGAACSLIISSVNFRRQIFSSLRVNEKLLELLRSEVSLIASQSLRLRSVNNLQQTSRQKTSFGRAQ